MRKFLLNTKGVAVVEFALTVGLFLFVFFMNFELSRLAVTSGYLDLGIAQSVIATKNTKAVGHDYGKIFKENLNKYLGSPEGTVMKFLLHKLEPEGLNVEIKYANCGSDDKTCIKAILDGNFREPQSNEKPPTGRLATLAFYNLNFYKYEFVTVFPFLPKSWINNTLSRKFLVLHEYERSSF